MPRPPLLRAFKSLEIEEKILNIGALIALIGVFMPWFGGSWFGEQQMWSGFGFYTSFIGILLFLAHAYTLSITVLPMFGHRVIRSSLRDLVRLIIGLESVLLVVVALSIYTNITFDFSQVEIRFGIYMTLVGSIIVSLYSFLRLQQQRKREVAEFFHRPERSPARSSSPSPQPPSRSDVSSLSERQTVEKTPSPVTTDEKSSSPESEEYRLFPS